MMPILRAANEEKITEAGGPTAWDALSLEEQVKRNAESHHKVCVLLGEGVFEQLSSDEKKEVNFLVWAGCCMHKEMNSVKGGNTAMMAYWSEEGLTGPIKLMNRDNAAAAAAGTSQAKDQANDVSQAGGVKLTSLAGAVFKNKDDKKCQQNTLRYFFETKIRYMVTFPDTSNTIYGSHCAAAAVLVTYLLLFLEFLELVPAKKDSGRLNHMEANVERGLKDDATVTELCTMTLYDQAVSHPYRRQTRQREQKNKNVLETVSLQHRVVDFCQEVIDNPKILMGDDASYEQGTLDGKVWELPEAVHAVRAKIPTLLHFRGVLVAFFKGALETWKRFTSEFAADGVIAQLTPEERKKAFMKTTNDDNEGTLGAYRVGARRAPWMTLAQWNARAMWKRNKTKWYYQHFFSSKDRKFVRVAARKLDRSGAERKHRQAQAEAGRVTTAKKKTLKKAKKAKRDAVVARIDAVKPILDILALQKVPCKLKVPEIDLQLDWHRWNGGKDVPMKKLLKLKALIDSVKAYREREAIKETSEVEDDAINNLGEESDKDLY